MRVPNCCCRWANLFNWIGICQILLRETFCVAKQSEVLIQFQFALLSFFVARSTVCTAELLGVKSIDRNDSCWMHRRIWRWLTANVFIGDGWNTHIKISQEPDTLCEFANDFASVFSQLENPYSISISMSQWVLRRWVGESFWSVSRWCSPAVTAAAAAVWIYFVIFIYRRLETIYLDRFLSVFVNAGRSKIVSTFNRVFKFVFEPSQINYVHRRNCFK